MVETYGGNNTGRNVLGGIILFGILELVSIKWFFPAYFTFKLLFIPAYFLLLGVIVLIILSRMKVKKIHPGRAVARLMLFNVAQMTLSFFLLFGYYYFTEVKDHSMLFAFCIFYIFFMGLKLSILYNIDKHHKNEK